MSRDYVIEQHKEWLGYLQSESSGLVVAPSALKAAQIQIDKNIFDIYSRLQSLLGKGAVLDSGHYDKLLRDFFEWRDEDISDVTDADFLVLPEYHETVMPNKKLIKDGKVLAYLLFLPNGQTFEDDLKPEGSKWEASYQQKFERLLRDKEISLGIAISNSGVRITYAPKQETSGYLTFPFAIMSQVEGRSTLSACHKLLNAWAVFDAPDSSRLISVLRESRNYQNTVSIELSGQVLSALYELVRGIDEAHRITKKSLLAEVIKTDPNLIYKGLLTVLLRLVFLLYAEDRDVLYTSKGENRRAAAEVFKNHYSINALYEQLRSDAAIHLDTMGQRFGAWGRLLSLFRAVYEGVEYDGFKLLGRKGHLFDPERFLFLEGRDSKHSEFQPPPIADGTIYKVLSFLMTLNGERISYRSLDVEQIGSVYETVMGFRLEIASGPSIGIKPKKAHGAPVVISLSYLLGVAAKDRPKWLKENTDQEDKSVLFRNATTIDQLVAALDRKIDRQATPDIVPEGSLVLQPSLERRKTGSHYTPRSLTEPIVRKALDPIFLQLGDNPTPQELLTLKVCDPAMGSGAFLVEACRQLAQALVKSWAAHDIRLKIPPDETELLCAQRIVARKCLYGVDKNPMAVDLAKLSLWLATFASDHEFTFLDHNLKCGDSLVGLGLSQILGATFENGPNLPLPHASIAQRLTRVRDIRLQISTAGDEIPIDYLSVLKIEEDSLLNDLRCVGDAIIYSFFSKDRPRSRREELNRVKLMIEMWFASGIQISGFTGLRAELEWLRETQNLRPFHWEVEFPEVFSNPLDSRSYGFTVFVGNPPFAGKNNLIGSHPEGYVPWLCSVHPDSHGNADIVAHFFRRSFNLLRAEGVLGLIATNTISQGDTRFSGLTQIVNEGGEIFSAVRRLKWPGQAAVVVSLLHIFKGTSKVRKFIDGVEKPFITSYLRGFGTSAEMVQLRANKNIVFVGPMPMGDGFYFRPQADVESEYNSIEDMEHLLSTEPACSTLIFPYIGGDDFLSLPQPQSGEFVFNFGNLTESEAMTFHGLYEIAKRKVLPKRAGNNRAARKNNWWKFGEQSTGLEEAKRSLSKVIVHAFTSTHVAFGLLDSRTVFPGPHCTICSGSMALLGVLQSRIHEEWVRMFGSSLKDDIRYTPSDCFETFPFPNEYQNNQCIEELGKMYSVLRQEIMILNSEGLTKTYNRFHSSSEESEVIAKLRSLHEQMDQAVLNAYGWSDLRPVPEFLADYDDDAGDASYRLRWPDNIRDQILGRLMELNARNAADEAAQGGNR